jgi:hypothetical protein
MRGGETQVDAYKGGRPSRASLSTPNPIHSRIVLHLRGCPSHWPVPAERSSTHIRPIKHLLDSQHLITMLAIARCFKKPDKWTIGHFEGMQDGRNQVEQRLVEKDSEQGSGRPS